MLLVRWVWRLVAVAVAATLLPSAASAACTVTPQVTTTAGPYSPAAVAAGKVPTITGQAGLTCTATVLTLFGGNYLRATFSSLNGMTLKNGAKAIPYAAFADSGATVPLTNGSTTDYMQNNLLNVLGLLGSSNATLPLYIRPGAAAAIPNGSYVDKITIAWDWRICSVAYVAGNCLGTLDRSSGSSVITVTVNVAAQDVTMTITSVATWDPVNGTTRPFALPDSKGRTSLAVRNPDLVALDDGSLALVYRVPARTSVALDGDGTTSSTVFGFTDGSPASGTTLSYTPGSATDDVDFSTDNGATWTYSPVAGDRASEAAVTALRFRPKGAMKAGSAFTLSFPYRVR